MTDERDHDEARSSRAEERASSRSGSRRLEAERDEYLDDLQRLAAEFDNYRKRAARDQESLVARAHERLVKELLPVLDDLERALEAAERARGGEARGGRPRSSQRELRAALARRASPRSRPTASSTRTSTRRCSRSRPRRTRAPIIEVLQKGYRLGDRVLRPARVVISQGESEAERDLYEILGVAEDRVRRTRSRRPTASSPASTTRTRTRATASRGALQGGPGRLRRPRATRRSASSTTSSAARMFARRRRRQPCRRRSATSTRPRRPRRPVRRLGTSAASSDARRQAAPARAAAGERGRDVEVDGQRLVRGLADGRRDQDPGRARARLPRRAAARARSRARRPMSARSAAAAASSPRARACSRCHSRARAAAATAPSSRSRATRATAPAASVRTKRYTVKIPPGVKDGTRIRLKGKGEPGRNGGPPGDLYVSRASRRRRSTSAAAPTSSSTCRSRTPRRRSARPSRCRRRTAQLSLKVPAGSQDGKLLRVRGQRRAEAEGLRAAATCSRALRSTVPTKLTKAEREALEDLQKVSRDERPARGRLLVSG